MENLKIINQKKSGSKNKKRSKNKKMRVLKEDNAKKKK